MPELTPPETSPVITLEAPQPVAVVPQDEADQIVKLDLTKVPELDAKVNDFVTVSYTHLTLPTNREV